LTISIYRCLKYAILSLTIKTILIFDFSQHQKTYGTKDGSFKHNSSDLEPFFLPFNSHILDQSFDIKEYSKDVLPFP
jgi:hypothetical protein